MTLSMRQQWNSSDFLKPFCLYKRKMNLGNHSDCKQSLKHAFMWSENHYHLICVLFFSPER